MERKKQLLNEHPQQRKEAAATTWKTSVAFALLLVYLSIVRSPLCDSLLPFEFWTSIFTEWSLRESSTGRKGTESKGEAEQGDSHIYPDYFFLTIHMKQTQTKDAISSETIFAACSFVWQDSRTTSSCWRSSVGPDISKIKGEAPALSTSPLVVQPDMAKETTSLNTN